MLAWVGMVGMADLDDVISDILDITRTYPGNSTKHKNKEGKVLDQHRYI